MENYDERDWKKFDKKVDRLKDSIKSLEGFFKNIKIENQEIVSPAVQEFKKAASELQGDYNKMVRDVAGKLGCNSTCINSCAT